MTSTCHSCLRFRVQRSLKLYYMWWKHYSSLFHAVPKPTRTKLAVPLSIYNKPAWLYIYSALNHQWRNRSGPGCPQIERLRNCTYINESLACDNNDQGSGSTYIASNQHHTKAARSHITCMHQAILHCFISHCMKCRNTPVRHSWCPYPLQHTALCQPDQCVGVPIPSSFGSKM
jgi:hypothetical protein